jgi:hypothetical protein
VPDAFFTKQYNIAQNTKDTLSIKTAVSAFATVLMTILTLLGLPAAALSICSIILSGILYGVFFHEFNDALVSVFKLKPSNDSFNSIALIFSVIRAVSLIFINNVNSNFISPVIFLSITISMIMKLVFVQEIINNLNFIKNNKIYLVDVADINLAKRYINQVCMVNPVVNFPNIIDTTYANDPSEEKSKLFVPAVCVFIFIISLIIFLFKGVNIFFTSLCTLFAICASFTGEMTFVLPYMTTQKKLRKLGSILLGYHSINSLKDISTLIIQDSDLFPKELAQLIKLRFKRKEYVAKSVEYSAALLIESNSPLKNTFLEILDCSVDKLPEVEKWRSLKNYGIAAIINGDSVLLGNRSLLLSYDIPPLTQEQEATLLTMNRNILYCAINGEIAAIILAQYVDDPVMKKAAEHVGGDFTIIVETNDCNITENMVQKRYDLSSTKIIVPDNDETLALETMRKKFKADESIPVMISTKNAIGTLESVKQAKDLFEVIDVSILTKQSSIILGIILTVIALFMVPNLLSAIWIFIFNLLWTIPIIFLSVFKK